MANAGPGKSATVNHQDSEREELVSKKVCDLPLEIRDSHLGALIEQVYAELKKAGVTYRPDVYLSDGWGCPDSVPVIGIPFYLVDARLCDLVSDLTDFPAETDNEIIMYLRHESGHAFNYAYRLYAEPEWQSIFGSFAAPYHEGYQTAPFSTHFVRHIPGWYAQKHPDEDFAESFAVWLTPGSDWRRVYAGTPALAKLRYVDAAVKRYAGKPPGVSGGKLDRPLAEIRTSVGEWCRMYEENHRAAPVLPDIIDEDLKRLFPAKAGDPAGELVRADRKDLIRNTHFWTGIDRDLLIVLVNELTRRAEKLGLKFEPEKKPEQAMNVSTFVATLAMNYQKTGRFME